MTPGWRNEPFDAVIADESGGNMKVPQSEFLPAGRYAVVDQGKELIAGYVNDASRLCRAQLPVIIFGDHTRCFKYVEFPFCMGADGIKVLRPRSDADVKYLYHYFRQLRLTEGGYDRHFKYLKRSSVVLPPLAEQQRIAEVLDRAEALRTMRHAAFAQLDTLAHYIFLDMFGDPARNSKGWPIRTIGEITECLDRLRKPVTESDRVLGTVPYYGANGQQGWIDSALFDEPLVLVAEDGGYFDTPERGVAYRIDGPAWVNNHAHILRALTQYLDTEFLHRALRHYDFMPHISGTTRAKLTQGKLSGVKLIVPPVSLQADFGRRAAAVEKLKSSHGASLAELDALFASLRHHAFRGEL